MTGEQPEKSIVAKREEETLAFWKREKIFEKSLKQSEGKPEFVFYDGPPFATGLPHTGTLLSSVAKDVIPRYKTMCGFYVRRRWGWDCHGLPIEHMIEKELGLKSKKDIEAMGVEKFNETCRMAVLRYAEDWRKYVNRIGRWVEFDNAYKTMDATYTGSVWWALKELDKKGLLYEGRKVLMYCPHCETPLAKAEIAMDNSYKDVTEDAVTAKFKIKNPEKIGLSGNVFLLAWTTTPWTLPANVALAVGPKVEYSLLGNGDENFVLATDLIKQPLTERPGLSVRGINRFESLTPKWKLLGKELVGLEYEPLFDVPKMKSKKSYKVYVADFVNTQEGTGIVHTAVIYGEDDYQLGLREGLPMVPLLNPNGTYNNDAPEFLRGQYIKRADKMVIEDLEKKNLLFAKAPNTHPYPHCHRCNTPLIYNALSSWFINIQKIKQRMIELNEKINWVPEHLKHGRFLNIVENAPDWGISRNRYWASPLPIWKHSPNSPGGGGCERVEVIGSLEELRCRTPKSGNKYYLMRHGKTANNSKGVISDNMELEDPLTKEGEEEVRIQAKNLMRERKIDVIVHSPFQRTRRTAEIVAQELGFKNSEMMADGRIGEIKTNMTGKIWREYWAGFPERMDRLHGHIDGGENLDMVRTRAMATLYDLDKTYADKNILIVTHEAVTRMLEVGVLADMGLMDRAYIDKTCKEYENAEIGSINFWPFPHDAKFVLDLHRPYIDEVKLKCECGGIMTRIPEVVDCWVESGSMPFAEYHYPFENKHEFEKRRSGDYIVEYVGQTRTWFYYLLAISSALFDVEPFKNVVVTGNILATDGSKMSKSKGNYTDPLIVMNRYGADAYRFALMSSVVMRAEDVNFRDEDVKEVQQRIVNILWNVVVFYKTYVPAATTTEIKSPVSRDSTSRSSELGNLVSKSKNILDKWILARLAQLHTEVTSGLDRFNTVRATRPFREFVDDFSTWYLRRSRDRFKGDNKADKQFATETTRYVLLELSKLLAPFMPFLAEQVYKAVGGPLESVHLEDWSPVIVPRIEHSDILQNMRITRDVVSKALEFRTAAGIKVRQPLPTLEINSELSEEYLVLIRDEMNVKEVKFGPELFLNTTITPELKLEGEMRDLVRQIQDKRKEMSLQPGDKVKISLADKYHPVLDRFDHELRRLTNTAGLSVDSRVEDFTVEKL
ncbi:MAG: hypothetical protein A2749_02925 [Parcubacteria group bacterium RIFCSPHIGHO2_01_FULL_45_26]|nr:MAG: hypothetical protein A2749_02925 [Parcubacteria group bacterium RIFCSPHIGHO2_01_FULL_45_26]